MRQWTVQGGAPSLYSRSGREGVRETGGLAWGSLLKQLVKCLPFLRRLQGIQIAARGASGLRGAGAVFLLPGGQSP